MKQKSIGSYEAKTNFSDLLCRVEEAGAEYIITRHDKPVALLVPVDQKVSSAEAARMIAQWREQPNRPTLNGLKIRDLINEGRA